MQRSQAEAKRAAFLNPEEKEGEKSEKDLSRQRGGGGLQFSRGAQPTPDFQNYRFGKLKLVNILYHLSTIFGN